MPPVLAWVIGISILVFIVLMVVVSRRRERERTEAMQRLAETAGLAFAAKGDLAVIRSLGDVPLFERGHSRQATNVMTGRLGDQDVAVFDYRYTTGSGKHQHTTHETVVLLPGAKRSLPDLRMAPENPLYKVAELFGYQDIDFDSNPDFSRRYVVKGRDEAAIRAALYPRATSYFGEHEGWTIEVRSGTVAIYRAGYRPKADDMRSFIEDTRAAARSL
jgi:hypothetical protein